MKRVYEDNRGWVFVKGPKEFISYSVPGVFRGMHFQIPFQEKRIKVLMGEIVDFWIDLKTGKGRYKVLFPSSDELVIPEGFGHGFYAVKESMVHYTVNRERAEGKEYSFSIPEKYLYSRGPLVMSDRDQRALPLGTVLERAGVK